jgi:hypothetical protein
MRAGNSIGCSVARPRYHSCLRPAAAVELLSYKIRGTLFLCAHIDFSVQTFRMLGVD